MNRSFRRKIIYLCVIAALLVPLSLISRPASRNDEGAVVGGGILSRLRRENGLAEAELGEIDPAGESMKLATLGMRGVAANIMWLRANDYKKKEKWDKLTATLNQITKLQPHFIKVWEFQAWNLSYNVSVEFDDFRQRYQWVVKGIDFIIGGTEYNRDEPRLLSAIGWSTGHKIGRADEKVQYRRLFRDDDDFHRRMPDYVPLQNTMGPEGKPDNWLLSHEWYRIAQNAARIRPLRGTSPLIFHSRPPMALIDHGTAIEEEGFLNEFAQLAWRKAGDAWQRFGNRDIPTSANFSIRLGSYENKQNETSRLKAELEEVAGVTIDQITEEKRLMLSDEERAALEVPVSERTSEEHLIVQEARTKMEVSYGELVDRTPSDRRGQARLVAARLVDAEEEETYTRRYRSIVNYDYWETRCEVEQTDEAILARKYVYDADRARRATDYENAKELYDQAWDKWAILFEQYPELMDDTAGEDIVDAVKRYKRLLSDLDETFPPADFPLIELVKLHNPRHKLLDTEYLDEDATSEEEEATVNEAEPEVADDSESEEESPATDSAPAPREVSTEEEATTTDPVDAEQEPSNRGESDDAAEVDDAS